MALFTFEPAGTVVSANGNSSGVADLVNPATFGSSAADAPQYLSVLIRVTAVSGTTPSLTVEVQWSNDGTNFVSATTADNFTAITAVGTALKQFNIKGRYARLKYTITGTTPTETVDITGLAV
jgi:hypothetical protein